jgi:hypothetical protein
MRMPERTMRQEDTLEEMIMDLRRSRPLLDTNCCATQLLADIEEEGAASWLRRDRTAYVMEISSGCPCQRRRLPHRHLLGSSLLSCEL